MAVHGPYKSKTTAKTSAKRYRKKGLNCSLYKKNGKWYLSSTR